MSKQPPNKAASSVRWGMARAVEAWGTHRACKQCHIDQTQWLARELDVHHIVAAGLAGAAPGRRLLARWSISVHSIVNAAIIPRSFHQGQGLHRQEFLQSINLRLSSAALFAEAVLPHGGFAAGRLIMLQTIQKIGSELVARTGRCCRASVAGRSASSWLLRSASASGSAGRGPGR